MTAPADAPAPVGYRDPAAFTDLVMRFSPPCEPFDLSVRRLWRCVRQDADALGVRAELSPARVAYAYRHHLALRRTLDAPPAPRQTPRSAEDALREIRERAEMRRETCRYLEKVVRRATRRKMREMKEENNGNQARDI